LDFGQEIKPFGGIGGEMGGFTNFHPQINPTPLDFLKTYQRELIPLG
jgi:hypothetical protein